jgi:hypothetical protein
MAPRLKQQPTCVAVQTRRNVHVEICNEQTRDRRRIDGVRRHCKSSRCAGWTSPLSLLKLQCQRALSNLAANSASIVGPADRTAVTRGRSAFRSSHGLFQASATNAFQWLIQGVAMRIMPTTSWRQRIVCASVAAAASCSALTLGVIFASRYVPSVTSEAIAAKIEQQRLARIEAEREFVDLRSDTARYAPLTDQEIVATQSPERKLESVDGASRSGADFRLRIEQRAKEAKDRKAPANQKPM